VDRAEFDAGHRPAVRFGDLDAAGAGAEARRRGEEQAEES
jgi:hypothetical protein